MKTYTTKELQDILEWSIGQDIEIAREYVSENNPLSALSVLRQTMRRIERLDELGSG